MASDYLKLYEDYLREEKHASEIRSAPIFATCASFPSTLPPSG